uniref:CCT-theta n=1 Tax=Chlamydomonas leiostraca TaxID=1034604 RepID=A0A7S0S258_9CHLO|eukprot:CAMPEP_0202857340 /NCGR_PEP_ID=MMETSP1391-20130828/323_1 /ASSEMBLY_ACC=CAM_ASM_000867 /TAXON_ID=1034604 /ORGANISM="Chlamydomonas leiostraca, Strain SAG 11-49" /LENGTH=544 /DNA_ID=CAMNT_0049536131 /DNA_START=80 /DNA_END=1714 /DNA_ORIENTATION=+
MAPGMGLPYGLQAMLKEGHKHFAGVDEAVVRNIEACKNLAQIVRTSLGPNGMNKMVINHLERLFVTSDASTIVTELEVNHPAAKLLVHAAKAQEAEIGDGTNLVLTLGGELMANAEGLLRDGLHTAEIADGYAKAAAKALEVLESLVLDGTKEIDIRNRELVAARIKGAISSKINGYEDMLAKLVADACIEVMPKNPVNFNVDNVRVVKIPGGGLPDSSVIKGMVLRRDTEGTVKSAADAKVAVYSQGVDTSSTDTKGTVLIRNAEELENYSKTEESKLEEYIKAIADAGVKVVVSGSAIGEMAMHFIEKYGMMALRIPSKFELLRLCKATGATARSTFGAPSPEELGFAKHIGTQEIGGAICVVLQQDASLGAISTVVLRGSTEGFLDDVERAVNDGVNAVKSLGRDARVVPGGGAAELEMSRQLGEWGKKLTGLEQYAIKKFAEAFEVVPRTLAENSGLNATDVVSALVAAHAQGQAKVGVDIETGVPRDLAQDNITDLFSTKWWAVKLAADAAVTVLRVDQIIMSKQAGGPKPRGPGGDDD